MALNDLRLTFRDEFNSLSLDTGTAATDPNLWNSSMHNGYVRSLSGNKELQIYMDPDYKGLGVNPFSVNNGVLSIKAAPASAAVKSATGYGYTSGALTTQGAFSQAYGYFEVRAQVPEGKGLWPAFWLLNENENWPPELDVMEMIGSEPKVLHQSVHTDFPDTTKVTYSADKLSAGFHTYGMDWTKSTITFYLDGKATGTVATPSDVNSPMYMVLNMAVGGTWPGSPDSTTNWANAKYNVDYVRVYQHTGVAGSGGVLPASGSTSTAAPAPTAALASGLVISNGTDIAGATGTKFAAPDSGASTSKTYTASQLGLGTPSRATVTVAFDAQKNVTATNNGAWNDIKNAAYASATTKGVTLNNFVGVNVQLTGGQDGAVTVKNAKRGTIATSGGADKIAVAALSNTTTDNTVTINSGAGNDTISFSGAANTRAAIAAGDGTDTIGFGGKASGTINGGAGNDRVNVRSTGNVSVTGGGGADVFSFIAGAHATITDFKAGEDRVEISGASASAVKVRTSGTSTLIDLNGINAVTLAGVALSTSQLNLSYA